MVVEDHSTKSKRIAKNTIMLYIRMIFMMVVSLYTSRVILAVLGVEDYGVYNVVAGVVTMFSFFTSSLGAAISRFLTYALGKGDIDKLNRIFCTCVNVQLGMSIMIVILAEIVGVWFLNNYLNIPPSRLGAANWVFQCALAGFVFNLISVPYNASIIAHERMGVFAIISIFEVSLKLVIVFMLYISPYDKLKTYAVLFALIALTVRLVYGSYCRRHFSECRYHFIIDKDMLREISGFAGWNLLGTGAYLFNTQGVNIVTNLYFGVTVNAARGVANRVEAVIRQFVANFTTALNPQITKSYAAGDMSYMYTLVCRGAKYSYLLMLFFAVPFIYEADTILQLWLKEVPPMTSIFVRLSIIGAMFDILCNSIAHACWATGKVKQYYLLVGPITAMVFFISWGLFAIGLPAYSSYVVFICVYFVLIFIKLFIIKGLINIPIKMYFKQTLWRIVPTTFISFAICYIPYSQMPAGILRLFVTALISSASIAALVYFTGLEKSERQLVISKANNFFSRIKKK